MTKAGPESRADGGDGVAIHPPSQVLLCNVVDVHSTINQPPPLHQYQYGLLRTTTQSATFHANFLDQRLRVDLIIVLAWGQRSAYIWLTYSTYLLLKLISSHNTFIVYIWEGFVNIIVEHSLQTIFTLRPRGTFVHGL